MTNWFQKINLNCHILSLQVDGLALSENAEDNFDDCDCKTEDTAVILYTSGTTGQPKGAMITHGNLISNALALSKAWHWQQNDILIHALPIFHIHGLFVATHLAVINSSTILFLDKFDPDAIAKLLPQATVYMGVPTHYVRLLKNENFNRDTCDNMRLFTSGSAPLLAQTFVEFEERVNKTIVERYGMTETGMNTSNPYDGRRKPGTVGFMLDGVEGKIIEGDGAEAATGNPGILYVKGKNVFKGYWRMPEKTQEEFSEDGYFKTGDIATKDPEGYVSIIGRNKDMIITGGLNVYPKELESIIDKLPGVLESAVIGIVDEDFGEAVTAIIVKKSTEKNDANSLLKEDIIKVMKTLVANFKVPKQVHFVDKLPRNTMGKVQKVELRKMFA